VGAASLHVVVGGSFRRLGCIDVVNPQSTGADKKHDGASDERNSTESLSGQQQESGRAAAD
jgi:hypothetical protein